MAKSIIEELVGYRVRVERDGKDIVNLPGILALPGLLAAPKMGMIGMIAAPLLGCSVHLDNPGGKEVDVGKKVQEAAETIVDTARKTAKTIEEEINRAWEAVSADDPEGCPVGEENEDEPAEDAAENTAEEAAVDADVAEDTAEDPAEDIAEDPENSEAGEIPTIRVKPDDPAQMN